MAIKVGEKDLFPYLGDYGPVSIYKGKQKLAGYKWAEKSGRELYFDNTYNSHVHIEVDGQSYQHAAPTPDYPSEIHSLNDFDVVSSVGGRNLLIGSKDYSGPWRYRENWTLSSDTHKGTLIASRTGRWAGLGQIFNVFKGEQYTFSAYVKSTGTRVLLFLANSTDSASLSYSIRGITLEPDTWTYVVFVFSVSSDGLIYPRFELEAGDKTIYVSAMKLEKGSNATLWTPAPEDITKDSNHPLIDKINLNLSEPLRSVRDVKDRLFKDSNGLWKVERNVGETYFDGNEDWTINKTGDDTNTVSALLYHSDFVRITSGIDYFDKHITSHFINRQVYSTENEGTMYNRWKQFYIRINKDRLTTPDLSGIKNWFKENPLQVIYIKDTPTIETLDQDLQDKLNTLKSFKDSNYVYTVLPNDDLTPTIHAKTEVKDI